jgi:acyl phosphate:glycerol-3-phosphate acyltransferase
VIFGITRVSSLSALVAATLAPVYGYYLLGHGPETRFLAGILATLSLLVLARHHSNIRKLISGEEKAFKRK